MTSLCLNVKITITKQMKRVKKDEGKAEESKVNYGNDAAIQYSTGEFSIDFAAVWILGRMKFLTKIKFILHKFNVIINQRLLRLTLFK